ncbi:MAG: radical SAM/SPASM domain-containing protein [Candidatus Omnitrophota bacterium]
MESLGFPRYLSIQTTSLCNAGCIFCPYKEIKDTFPARIMDMGLYRKIIDECASHNHIEKILLYMNNEPLTDPYLIERINYAKEMVPRAGVHILTNGLLLTGEMSGKLLDSQLDWIGISFHGLKKETIEKAMGLPYEITFQRINNFIDQARDRKNIKEYVMLTFLRHKYLSEEEKEEAIAFWRKRGLERINYFDGPISRAGNVPDLPKVRNPGSVLGCNTIWADQMLHIVEDGKVVLCCMDWRREVILGDLNQESITRVWSGSRRQVWQRIKGKQPMSDEFLCRRCEAAVLEDKGTFLPAKSIKGKKRRLFKWAALCALFGCTFFYIMYFWMYMIVKKQVLWGGGKSKP